MKSRANNRASNRNDMPQNWGIYGLGSLILIILFPFILSTENYSEGERIGFITKFSKKGRFWKSWEGELNLTQTGMNTSSVFQFSLDNDMQQNDVVSLIDSAANNGWKVKLNYHETSFKNWFDNRGETNYFIRNITILDRHPLGISPLGNQTGRVVDTIYFVIDKNELRKK